MRIKISLKKTQFLVNIMFLFMLIVWILFDVLKIIESPLTPGNHLLFEFPGMIFLGSLFATKTEEPRFLWPLVLVMLVFPPVIYGLFNGHLMSALFFNLAVMIPFFIGYFLQRNRKIVKVEKA